MLSKNEKGKRTNYKKTWNSLNLLFYPVTKALYPAPPPLPAHVSVRPYACLCRNAGCASNRKLPSSCASVWHTPAQNVYIEILKRTIGHVYGLVYRVFVDISHPFPTDQLHKEGRWTVYSLFKKSLSSVCFAAAKHSLDLHLSNTLYFIIVVNSQCIYFPQNKKYASAGIKIAQVVDYRKSMDIQCQPLRICT